MNLIIPDAWKEVTKWTFYEVLNTLNWERDAFGDGEYYVHRKKRFGARRFTEDGYQFYLAPKFVKEPPAP